MLQFLWPGASARSVRYGNEHQTLQEPEDFLLITWDSCRYDAFVKARLPCLSQYGPPRRAWAMGTFTLPAHVAMFQGFLPHVFCNEPLCNRYQQQLWRIGTHRRAQSRPLVAFPEKTRNIMSGFRRRGYFTAGVAAMRWFRDAPVLREGFDKFSRPGCEARRQNGILIDWIERYACQRSCFAFVNYGETHSPYCCEGMDESPPQFEAGRFFNQAGVFNESWNFNEEGFARQVACAEFLDARTSELIECFRRRGRPTTVIVCADHGECFGENGLHGHAFYHEKVMEVPLLIFRLNAPPHPAASQAYADNAEANCH
jgi:hypothetical protein